MHDIEWRSLLPGMFMIGSLLIAAGVPERLRRLTIPVFVVVLMLSYLSWRALYTLDGPGVGLGDRIFIAAFFSIEVLGFLDALLLLLLLTRYVDRSAEADAYEKRLSDADPRDLPAVDVFIPTYNEPLDVLKRTVFAAINLDWPDVRVWVLDDGRREWLRAFCERHGVGYVTREDKKGAKAGNINAALARTAAPFVVTFDADFAPRRNFLRRTMGFFADPSVGIVQTAHTFFNSDPAQNNLRLYLHAPDEQRFFFNVIMPARDAWDVAFCCGSNSVLRRAALARVGGRLPDGSITEDIHLTLVLLRQGYVTRYLPEALAYGLAPESTRAFFIQRERWARGAIQTMFLRTGPFGPGLTLLQRLTFLPSYWLVMPLVQAMVFAAPVVFLWTGFTPIANIGVKEVIEWQLPVIIGIMGAFTVIGRSYYHFFANMVTNAFMAARLLPAVVVALWAPFSMGFRVTPKGSLAGAEGQDRYIVTTASILIFLLISGVFINVVPDWRIISREALVPVVAAWAVVNATVLTLVAMIATERPSRRQEERFVIPRAVVRLTDAAGRSFDLGLVDLSLLGAGLRGATDAAPGSSVVLTLPNGRALRARVVRNTGGSVGLRFAEQDENAEKDLTQYIFSEGSSPSVVSRAAPGLFVVMVSRIWRAD